MNAVPNPIDPPPEGDQQPISLAAERARAQLHEEIERVRRGVEQMLDELLRELRSIGELLNRG